MSYLDILNNYIEYNGNSSIACLKNRAHSCILSQTKNDLLVKLDPLAKEKENILWRRRRKEKEKEDNIGWYLGVLGQYEAVLVSARWYWVSIRRLWLILGCTGK